MLKSAILWLLLFTVVVEGFVRIKTTAIRRQDPNTLRQQLSSSKSVNQTLIDVAYDSYYTGIIHIGTPPRKYVVLFDTGSEPIWIAGTGCKYPDGTECKFQKHCYDVSESSTGKELNKNFTIEYGVGSASGKYVSDIIGLTSNQTGIETKKSFEFAYATELSQETENQQFDGIFGLAFSDFKTTNQSYIDYLRVNKVFDPPIFTIWLDRNATGKPLGGEIIFGGKDPARCGDDLVTVPVFKKPLWVFRIEKVLLNGQEISSGAYTVTDTGSTKLRVLSAAYDQISKKYPLGQEFDCNKYRDIELTIQIGEKPLKLTADDLIRFVDSGQCEFLITTGKRWILGDPFIKGYCQIHDYVKETLTFAPSKHPKLN